MLLTLSRSSMNRASRVTSELIVLQNSFCFSTSSISVMTSVSA